MPATESATPALPPITHTAQGNMRRLGVEIEFSGLSLEETAAVLRDLLGGPLEQPGRYEIQVQGDPAGPWQVELDFAYLKKLGRFAYADDLGGLVQELAEDVLRAIAERIVPIEVVGPPLPMDRLADVNPTRNRSLDMLPLFAYLDEARVRERVDDERVKARPTLHYRLPNSEIDRPDWDLNDAWNDWLVVERLATDPKRLALLCGLYAAFLDSPIERLTTDWADRTQQWLNNNLAR